MENREQNLENTSAQAVFNQSILTARLNYLSSQERSGTQEEPIPSSEVVIVNNAGISSAPDSLSLNSSTSLLSYNSGSSFTIDYYPDPIANVVWIDSDGRRYYNVPGTSEFRPVDVASLAPTDIVDTYATEINVQTKEKKKTKFLPKLTLKRDE